MTWADWMIQDLLAELEAPRRWSPARQRAEAAWRQIWCPPNCIKIRERLVSVEIKRRPKWRQQAIAA